MHDNKPPLGLQYDTNRKKLDPFYLIMFFGPHEPTGDAIVKHVGLPDFDYFLNENDVDKISVRSQLKKRKKKKNESDLIKDIKI